MTQYYIQMLGQSVDLILYSYYMDTLVYDHGKSKVFVFLYV